MRGKDMCVGVVDEGGEVWIQRIEDLLLDHFLGIFTSNPCIMENLRVLLSLQEACPIKLIE